MNSWLYLTVEGFAHSADPDFEHARVIVWRDGAPLENTSLSAAAAGLKDHEVRLILPMEMCTWLLTEPWPGRRRPSVQALAFAVEDQLAGDLDELHIAVGPADAQQRYPLLITHKQRLQGLLAHLHERGLNIVSVQADADVLPHDQTCMAWWDGRWIIGGALEARLALTEQALAAVKSALPTQLIKRDIDCNAPPEGAIDLLQGELRRQMKGLAWRRVGAGFLIIFALALGFTHWRSSFLEGEAARLQALSEQRFKTLYPEQTRIVDLSAQLKALQQQAVAPNSGHMARLVQLTEQVIGASSVEVQRMEWRTDVGWVLTITAASFAELEQLRTRGVQNALPVTLGTASQQGSRVQALLTLKDVI